MRLYHATNENVITSSRVTFGAFPVTRNHNVYLSTSFQLSSLTFLYNNNMILKCLMVLNTRSMGWERYYSNNEGLNRTLYFYETQYPIIIIILVH